MNETWCWLTPWTNMHLFAMENKIITRIKLLANENEEIN